MFERLHQDARRAVVRARHEAVRAGRKEIGCEHLLLGLLAEPGPAAAALSAAGLEITELRARLPRGTAARADPLDAEALASLGIDLDTVRRSVDAAFGPGALDRVSATRRGPLGITGNRLTTDAKKALELALRAAVKLRHREISSGYLLIGIIDQADNAALAILEESGVDAGALRADVLSRITAAA